jgi:hypothetical protein
MLKETELEKFEQEAFASFKALLPNLVSEAIEDAVKTPTKVVDWLQLAESNTVVVNYDDRLLEISQLRMLRRQLGTKIPHMMYRDYFKCIKAIHKMKMVSLYAVFKEYRNVIDDTGTLD